MTMTSSKRLQWHAIGAPLLSRRNVTTALVTGTATIPLAACGTTPVIDIAGLESQIADIITKVQQGVKDACSLVPAANSVLAVLMAIAGSNAAVAAFLAATAEAVTFISGVCPARSDTPRGTKPSGNVDVKGKNIPVVFY